MNLKVITLFFDSETGFDDEYLQGLLHGIQIVEVSDHFFTHAGIPCLTLLVRYREEDGNKKNQKIRRRTYSIRELDSGEKALYDLLSKWRRERSRSEGIPPYMICNNRQLVELVQKKTVSLSALKEIQGIGEAKAAKYGEELIQIVKKFTGDIEGAIEQ